MQDINKQVLTQTPVGMRLIALMMLYNSANFSRLRSYLTDSYHPSLFEEQTAAMHLALLKAQRRLLGRSRVRQVVASDKYQLVVLMKSEQNQELSLFDMVVEEEYPHRILRFERSSVG